jgi:hypothetical protein
LRSPIPSSPIDTLTIIGFTWLTGPATKSKLYSWRFPRAHRGRFSTKPSAFLARESW